MRRRVKPRVNVCKRRTNGASVHESRTGEPPAFYIAAALHARPCASLDVGRDVVLVQMKMAAPRGHPHCSVTPEDQICRTLCWIRYRGRIAPAVMRCIAVRGATARAASFLKHSLWRFRNTKRRNHCFALCRASQVVDQPAFCALEPSWHGCCLSVWTASDTVCLGRKQLHTATLLPRSSNS